MTTRNQSPGRQTMERLEAALNKSVRYSARQMHGVVVAYSAGGHVLARGPRGTGKTLMGKTLTKAMKGAAYNRCNLEAGSMPADLLGNEVYQAHSSEFVFINGPVFANVFFADEINRTPPKTQNCLLEALEEGTVSTGGFTAKTRRLPDPHIIIATRNLRSEDPNVFEMSSPLLDRFAVELLFTKLTPAQVAIVANATADDRHLLTNADSEVVSIEDILELRQEIAATTTWSEQAAEFAANLVCAIDPTFEVAGKRVFEEVVLECSPTRAVQWILRLARANAFYRGSACVTGDDIKLVFPDVVRHRIIMDPLVDTQEWDVEKVIEKVLGAVAPY